MNYEAVYRTAPATPGLLITHKSNSFKCESTVKFVKFAKSLNYNKPVKKLFTNSALWAKLV